jgi:hypothetical protein
MFPFLFLRIVCWVACFWRKTALYRLLVIRTDHMISSCTTWNLCFDGSENCVHAATSFFILLAEREFKWSITSVLLCQVIKPLVENKILNLALVLH